MLRGRVEQSRSSMFVLVCCCIIIVRPLRHMSFHGSQSQLGGPVLPSNFMKRTHPSAQWPRRKFQNKHKRRAVLSDRGLSSGCWCGYCKLNQETGHSQNRVFTAFVIKDQQLARLLAKHVAGDRSGAGISECFFADMPTCAILESPSSVRT